MFARWLSPGKSSYSVDSDVLQDSMNYPPHSHDYPPHPQDTGFGQLHFTDFGREPTTARGSRTSLILNEVSACALGSI